MDALSRVIDKMGSQQRLADKVGATQQAVSGWIRKNIPAVGSEFVIAVSRAVDFEVTPHQLRPDLYPHPEDGLPPEMRCQGAA